MDSHALARLLQDAEALAEHAAQVVADLARQVDMLVKAVRPVTLFMLTWHRSLRAFVTRAALAAMPFAIGFLTLVLTCYLAFQSSQLNQADMALRSYYEWVGQQPREKLYAAFKLFHYERVLNVTQPPLEQLDAYQKLVDDAQELAKKGAAIQNMLLDASTLHYVPQSIVSAAPAALRSLFARINAVVPEAAVRAADLPAVRQLDGPDGAGAAPPQDPRCDLAQRAVKRAGSTDSDKLVAAMEKTDYVGTIGRVEFKPKGDPHVHGLKTGAGFITGLMLEWQDGKQVNVWPKALAVGKVTFPSFIKLPAQH